MTEWTEPDAGGEAYIPAGSTRELRTAEIMVAMFDDQIAQHDDHWSKGRMARRRDRKSGRYDVTIDERIEGLREGRAKWAARIERLRRGEAPS